jgi:uncharacterized Zn-binding protein involved in type VI secretion
MTVDKTNKNAKHVTCKIFTSYEESCNWDVSRVALQRAESYTTLTMPKTNPKTIAHGKPTILIEGQPATIAGNLVTNDHQVISGEPTVLVGGRPIATLDGQNSVSGKPTVLIGDQPAK